jgi:hypothetical protein
MPTQTTEPTNSAFSTRSFQGRGSYAERYC